MIDGLFDIVKMIGDFVSSILDGLSIIVRTLSFLTNQLTQTQWLFPVPVYAVLTVGVGLIIVFRVVGR